MMTNFRNTFATIILVLLSVSSSAWTTTPPTTGGGGSSKDVKKYDTRRGFLFNSAAGLVASPFLLVTQSPAPAYAAAAAKSSSQDQKDRDNILKGYNRLQYLLDNWEKETTVCKTGQETTWGDRCERTPLKIMDYLGFKSIQDPLYQADKTIMRLLSSVPSSKEVEYMDAMEKYSEKAEDASQMAFVSSWGEANPGGGKDRVELFIERSKKMVIDSRDSLEVIMNILEIKY